MIARNCARSEIKPFVLLHTLSIACADYLTAVCVLPLLACPLAARILQDAAGRGSNHTHLNVSPQCMTCRSLSRMPRQVCFSAVDGTNRVLLFVAGFFTGLSLSEL